LATGEMVFRGLTNPGQLRRFDIDPEQLCEGLGK
jgi:hypothetical protein